MTTEERKQVWKANANSRRARIVREGGRQVNLLLEKPASDALHDLTRADRSGKRKTNLEVVSELLVRAAARLKQAAGRGGGRSK